MSRAAHHPVPATPVMVRAASRLREPGLKTAGPTVEGHLAFENAQFLRTAFIATRLRRWRASDLHTVAALPKLMARDLSA